MTKQEKAVVNMAKFLQAQSLLLLEKLNELDSDKLDTETNLCKELHEQAESLHKQLSAKLGEQQPFYNRLRPPDELHKNRLILGALVKIGETRQDSKDARSFPLTAPSCALLFPPYKFTAGLIRSFHLWGRYLSASLYRYCSCLGGSLQAGLSARTPRLARLSRLFR